MLLSALLSAPLAMLSLLFVPAYWDPVRIFEFGTGPEDIIFSFANGGIVWFIITLPKRYRVSVNIKMKRMLLRYAACITAGSISLIPISLGCNPMLATVVVLPLICIGLLWLRPEYWPLSVVGAAGFGLFYTIIGVISLIFFPDALQQWNPDALSGYSLLGIPVEEIAWSVCFGALWPLQMAFSFKTRITSAVKSENKHHSADCSTDMSTI